MRLNSRRTSEKHDGSQLFTINNVSLTTVLQKSQLIFCCKANLNLHREFICYKSNKTSTRIMLCVSVEMWNLFMFFFNSIGRSPAAVVGFSSATVAKLLLK